MVAGKPSSKAASPRQLPLSALAVSPRASPRQGTSGTAACARSGSGPCGVAGLHEPVEATLNRIAQMRDRAERRVVTEDRSSHDASIGRLDALRSVIAARASTRRSNGNGHGHRHGSNGSNGTSAHHGPNVTTPRARIISDAAAGTTLRTALGLPSAAPSLGRGTALILIDCQRTYTEGPMRLHRVEEALLECRRLLRAARDAGATVIHVVHDAGADSLYDVRGSTGAIVDQVKPRSGEKIIVKAFPSSFHHTDLEEYLEETDVSSLILAGFMTHCCVSSTARHAFNLGKFDNVTVVASATATRCLADAEGDAVDPDAMQRATLAGISELHANVVATAADVIDA
jgi:nicotinamidase-related amidase